MTTKLSLSFFLGALCPTLAIYLTGGSNRFIFTLGLILGLSLIILPLILWPKKLASWILAINEACEQFAQVIRRRGSLSMTHKVDDLPAPKTRLEEMITERDDKTHVIVGHEENPYVEDCVSALRNLGVAVNKAKRTVRGLVEMKEYGTLEELLKDAVKVATGKG